MIEISDPSFDLSQTQSYKLSIRLIPDGFCFAIFDIEKRLIHYSFHKHTVPDDNEFLKRSYEQVFFCCDSPSYTLLPQSIFQPELQNDYWRLNFGETNDKLLYDKVRLTDIVNLYSLDENPIFQQCSRMFPTMQVVHRQSIHINMAVMKNKQMNRPQLYLHTTDHSFDVLYLDKGKVILANSFSFHKEDEFLYFVLNIFDQLKLDQYQTEVLLPECFDGDLKNQLSQYLKNIITYTPQQKELSDTLNKEEIAKQYTLLNIPFSISNN